MGGFCRGLVWRFGCLPTSLMDESFLLLFFKKEALAFFLGRDDASRFAYASLS